MTFFRHGRGEGKQTILNSGLRLSFLIQYFIRIAKSLRLTVAPLEHILQTTLFGGNDECNTYMQITCPMKLCSRMLPFVAPHNELRTSSIVLVDLSFPSLVM